MKAKQIVIEVEAHHNVEDYRPYKIRFKDRGSFENNLETALIKAILKEGDWNGWFDDDCGILVGLKMEIESAVWTLVHKKKTKAVVLGCKEDDGGMVDPETRDDTQGLVIWIDRKEKNYGFGIGNRHQYDGKVDPKPLCIEHTDKYDVKWISFK